MKLWMQNVVDVCAVNGGRITALEIQETANASGAPGRGYVLLTRLKASRAVTVTVVDEIPGENAHTRKVYNVVKRA